MRAIRRGGRPWRALPALRRSDRREPPTGTRVLRAAPAEAAAVGELTERSYRSDGHLDRSDGDWYAAQLRDAAGRIADAVVLVAAIDDEIVATVTLAGHGTPYAETARPGELEVRMLAVAPEARQRGWASR